MRIVSAGTEWKREYGTHMSSPCHRIVVVPCRRFNIRPVSMGFHECFMHIEYSATSAKFYFLHETLRREKEIVSPW
jgi:hypothetical protein